jgi:hypothetical protein
MRRTGGLRTLFFSLTVLTLNIQQSGSQEQPCTNRKLPVSFRNAQNLPLQNVSVNDLEAKAHGKPIKVLSITPDPRPHRLVLIMDASGSMAASIRGETPLWKLELSLARHFYETNRERFPIALIIFNEHGNDVIDFLKGNSAVGERLLRIAEDRDYIKTRVNGRTALLDAILQGIQLLNHPNSADALYVLTDGGDNLSRQSLSEFNRHLAVSSVRVFGVLLYQSLGNRNRTPEEANGPTELAEITRKSGGEVLTAAEWQGNHVALSANAEAKAKSEETLHRLYQAIVQDSLLEIELPGALAKNERWELRFSNDARQRWKNAQITYSDILINCDAEVSGSSRN